MRPVNEVSIRAEEARFLTAFLLGPRRPDSAAVVTINQKRLARRASEMGLRLLPTVSFFQGSNRFTGMYAPEHSTVSLNPTLIIEKSAQEGFDASKVEEELTKTL